MTDVGKNIRHLRIQKHMTQDELAERLFVSRQTVSNYETGKSNPDIDMLLKIAEVFQTDVTVLIFGTSDMAERRKDVRRLAAAGAVLMVLVLFYLFAVPRARSLQMSLYISSPLFCMRLLLIPLILLLLGWSLAQFGKVWMRTRALSGRWVTVVFWAALFLIMLYFFSIFPFLADIVYQDLQYLPAFRSPDYSGFFSSDSSSLFPDFLMNYSGLFLIHTYALRSSFLFYLPWLLGGIILWNGSGKHFSFRRKKNKPSANA